MAQSTHIVRVAMGRVAHVQVRTRPISHALLDRRCHGQRGRTLGSAQMPVGLAHTIGHVVSLVARVTLQAQHLIRRHAMAEIQTHSATGLIGGHAIPHAAKVRRYEHEHAAMAAMGHAMTPAWLISNHALLVCIYWFDLTWFLIQ